MPTVVKLSNGQEWESKVAAKAYFKQMLHEYSDGETITDSNHHDDLCALVERFDALVADIAPKNSAGVAHFERRMNSGDGWSSPGFWIIRTDGSETDFSYIKAIDGRPKARSQEFYDACHNTVFPDLQKLKQRQFDHFSDEEGKVECDITGAKISFAEANLSHANPLFSDIVNEFREMKGWREIIPDGVITLSADKQLSSHFVKQGDAEEFRRLHHRRAVLRIIGKSRPAGSRASAVKRPLTFER